MRRNMDGDEMQISRPGWRWDTMWMEEGCNYKKLNGGEPGHRWRWDAHPETWMGLRWDLAGIEMQQDGVEGRLGWIWNANHGTWMEVRQDLDGVQALILKRGLVWDRTWMELWCKYHDLNGSEYAGGEMLHGCRWDTKLRTWMEVRQYIGGGEIRILEFGCRWDRTWMDVWRTWPIDISWMDVRCKYLGLDWYEMWPGCRWGRDRT